MFQKLTLIRKNIKTDKTRKRQIIYFAFFMLVFILTFITNMTNVTLASVVKPNSSFYVNDEAGVLSNNTTQYIIDTNIELQRKTGAQIVVVTVKSLGGMSIEEYANELFNTWEIGDKTKNNGLLLLCSYGDREFRVEVGYGLEGKLPDGKTGRMQDEYIIPYLKQDKFDEGIKNGYSAFLKEVADEYEVTITGTESAKKVENYDNLAILIFVVYIVLAIVFNIVFRRRRWKRWTVYLLWRWRRLFFRRRRLLRWRFFWRWWSLPEVAEVAEAFKEK